MKKRVCRSVMIIVSNMQYSICQRFFDVNFNSMYDVMNKVRSVESMFVAKYKQEIDNFSVSISRE